MNIAWITRSFLDYRVPVFEALSERTEGQLRVYFSGDYVPQRVQDKACAALGDRAIAMHGEWRFGAEDRDFMANRNLSLCFQPGVGARVRECVPDVIVCDGFFKWTVHGLMAKWRHRVPLVIAYEKTAHTERRAQRLRTRYRRFVVRQADATACNGSLSAAYVQSLGMPPDRITVGQMAADTAYFSEAASTLTPDDRRIIRDRHVVEGLLYLQVGRLIDLKGCRELLCAWSQFAEERTDVVLMFVGSGVLESELRAWCADQKLDSVRFVGEVSYGDLPCYYAAADVLVSATLEDNWSLVVAEGMASGLPVMCSRYNGCWPELVEEGKNGWVFDPCDTTDTVRALGAALAARGQLEAMGQRSRAIAAQHSPAHAARAIFDACCIAIRATGGEVDETRANASPSTRAAE